MLAAMDSSMAMRRTPNRHSILRQVESEHAFEVIASPGFFSRAWGSRLGMNGSSMRTMTLVPCT
jgi:hypothetical protein